MLTTDELRSVIKQARREAEVCTRFCVVRGMCGESDYMIHHNGLGPSDTDEQRVSAAWVLKLPEYQLVPWLTSWLIATHRGQHFDLNGQRRDRHVF
jgi:hypothetical protein